MSSKLLADHRDTAHHGDMKWRHGLALLVTAGAPTGCSEQTAPVGGLIGSDYAASQVVASTGDWESTGLDFDPDHPTRLWVSQRRPFVEGECNQEDTNLTQCRSLPGAVLIVQRATTNEPSWHRAADPNAWHFMRRPPGIALGGGQRFATCGEARTGNWDDAGASFIGPTLFSSNLAEFGKQPPQKNGSHLDMLHATPFCLGIAHERGNTYWLANGETGSLDRYDFGTDHGPGNDDHSDGRIEHFASGAVVRVANLPSQLTVHPETGMVYAVDTGRGRVVQLDPTLGLASTPYVPNYDGLAYHVEVNGVGVDELVPTGALDAPTGLALHNDVLYVANSGDGRLLAFTLDGELVREMATGLPEGALGGLTIGPDERLYLSDLKAGDVYRIELP